MFSLVWATDGYLALAAGLSAPWTPVLRSEPDRRPGPGGSSGSGSEAPLVAGRALQRGWEQTLDNKMEQNELNTCTTKTLCLSSGAQRAAFRLHQKQARSQATGDFSYDLHLLVLRNIVAINTHVLTEFWKLSRCYEVGKKVYLMIYLLLDRVKETCQILKLVFNLTLVLLQ